MDRWKVLNRQGSGFTQYIYIYTCRLVLMKVRAILLLLLSYVSVHPRNRSEQKSLYIHTRNENKIEGEIGRYMELSDTPNYIEWTTSTIHMSLRVVDSKIHFIHIALFINGNGFIFKTNRIPMLSWRIKEFKCFGLIYAFIAFYPLEI